MSRNLTFAAFAFIAFPVAAFSVSAQTFNDLRVVIVGG